MIGPISLSNVLIEIMCAYVFINMSTLSMFLKKIRELAPTFL
jgi:hypothetical protein